MIELNEKSKCCGCHACFNICPKNAIKMEIDEKGFKNPVMDKVKCVNCGLCNKVCPILNKKEYKNEPKVYAAYNKNEKIRLESSSGGVFTVIAEYILENNGVIYGASFDDEWLVKHIRITSTEELHKLRTSKYLQSNINDTYKLAKKDLDDGIKVLFTGTPCQVNGLLTYLREEYNNLYTQDIICHGAPSPKVWKKYLEYRESKDSNKPIKINFRCKDKGWNSYSIFFKYSNNEYDLNHKDDLYMQAFLRDASLRDSCYNCSFKDKNRKTDITLADFWGIDNVLPKMNDNKGTSLVIVNSNKGMNLFEAIKEKIVYQEVNFEKSIQYNTSMFQAVKKPIGRDEFFENIDKLEFDELVEKYTQKPVKVSFIRKVLRKIKKIIKRLAIR